MEEEKTIEELFSLAKNHPNDSIGENAKREIELYKINTEITRNKYLFANTIFLSIIALINILLAFIALCTKAS